MDDFKGITHEKQQEIRRDQMDQCRSNQEAQLKKQLQEERWAIQDISNHRSIALLDRATVRAAKEQAIAIRKENELKAVEDQERYDCINEDDDISTKWCTRTQPRKSTLRNSTPQVARWQYLEVEWENKLYGVWFVFEFESESEMRYDLWMH